LHSSDYNGRIKRELFRIINYKQNSHEIKVGFMKFHLCLLHGLTVMKFRHYFISIS